MAAYKTRLGDNRLGPFQKRSKIGRKEGNREMRERKMEIDNNEDDEIVLNWGELR
ncbi:hypothetical protein Scep_016549 [Stephania cephalantha]|uniref:Uncharacterized protein n=1 Tax=Stephania cephalantha TaxID=152367 RepID=A0AAP0IPM6_9MAGN